MEYKKNLIHTRTWPKFSWEKGQMCLKNFRIFLLSIEVLSFLAVYLFVYYYIFVLFYFFFFFSLLFVHFDLLVFRFCLALPCSALVFGLWCVYVLGMRAFNSHQFNIDPYTMQCNSIQSLIALHTCNGVYAYASRGM